MEFISISGIGYSGSGAVLDLLAEFDNCIDICNDDEFVFTYIPDGLDDLSYHLNGGYSRFHSSDIAITRFKNVVKNLGKEGWDKKTSWQLNRITDSFVKEITQLEWKGNWIYDLLKVHESRIEYVKYRIRRKIKTLLKKYFNKTISVFPMRPMYLSIEPNDFLQQAQKFISDILLSCGNVNSENIVLVNQGVPANNSKHYCKYYVNHKTIVVVRDPRDMYLNMKRVNEVNALWFPHSDVYEFINYFKVISKGVYANKSDKMLVVNFEDLIYNYENTVLAITEFVGHCGKHTHKLQRFNPKQSIQNTQLFQFYKEYQEDIEIIENELSEFLYSFNYTEKISHDCMF